MQLLFLEAARNRFLEVAGNRVTSIDQFLEAVGNRAASKNRGIC